MKFGAKNMKNVEMNATAVLMVKYLANVNQESLTQTASAMKLTPRNVVRVTGAKNVKYALKKEISIFNAANAMVAIIFLSHHLILTDAAKKTKTCFLQDLLEKDVAPTL